MEAGQAGAQKAMTQEQMARLTKPITDHAAALAKRGWQERWGTVLHLADDGVVEFGAPTRAGDPTIARCKECGQVWFKEYGWQSKR